MNSATKHACIIIDDPLLRENYGFLNYRVLLNMMDKHNFFTTIAFIPVNYSRTDKKIAALFQERADRFSICVHGCDHTGGEFANTDFNHLDSKVRLATARMVEHEKQTGIPFDRVMVFPQGQFSNIAMDVLRKHKYLAALNTDPIPVDQALSSDFPFFLRYKPEDVIDSVCGPIFIVLHHDYFKSGYGQLTDFVDALNAKGKNIKWSSVGGVIRSYLQTDESEDPSSGAPQNMIGRIDLKGIDYFGYREYVRIRMRRYTSEFRDNYLSKNDFILTCVKRLGNSLKI